jgi:deoxyribonuclease V
MFFRQKVVVPPELMKELTQKQEELMKKLQLKTPKDLNIKILAGCDSSIINDEYIFSIFVNFKYPTLEVLEYSYDVAKISLPYIPGFLAFREIPALLKAYRKLKLEPDLIMVDGNGIIHKRKMGIASHLGILLNKPTIGVAKKLLFGKFLPASPTKGSYSPVANPNNETIGYALRTKDRVKEVFVSPGHLTDLKTALEITLNCIREHKLPEPTRIADLYSKKYKNLIDLNHYNLG